MIKELEKRQKHGSREIDVLKELSKYEKEELSVALEEEKKSREEILKNVEKEKDKVKNEMTSKIKQEKKQLVEKVDGYRHYYYYYRQHLKPYCFSTLPRSRNSSANSPKKERWLRISWIKLIRNLQRTRK